MAAAARLSIRLTYERLPGRFVWLTEDEHPLIQVGLAAMINRESGIPWWRRSPALRRRSPGLTL
jgi:hypothetical protein